MSEIIIRRMTLADVDGVAAVEAATFPTPWSRDAFASEMKNVAARYLVAELDGAVIGYAGAWIIIDESHITNIAVLQEHRGRGIGRLLTQGLMQYLSNLGAAYATLEVRRSNEVAQNLYKSLGFIKLGVRKRYYEDNGEDALIMVCDHMPPVDPDFTEAETVTA
ncbi:MAG: ribosomal protein S18-alanine N-acetyltransferase [Clostridia bacterium]|nr:ribosomal protein S18-alanine N-acetyltransferase [Clostridia bacterium]